MTVIGGAPVVDLDGQPSKGDLLAVRRERRLDGAVGAESA
jgi:hypothetical protein